MIQLKEWGAFVSEDKLWDLFAQMSEALHSLHSKNIIHRDLKPENVFLTKKMQVKLGDLGMARIEASSTGQQTKIGGTTEYQPPELLSEDEEEDSDDIQLNQRIQTKEADMFSLGVIFYEVIALKHPFAGKNGSVLKSKIIKCKPDPLPIHISEPLKEVVMSLLNKPYIELFFYLTYPSSYEIKLELYNKHPYPSLIRLLDHQDIEIVAYSILSILNILISGLCTTSSTSPHPHFQTMIECNGINQIYNMYKRSEINKYSKDLAAQCIGKLFMNKEIPDQEMKIEIISHLKQLLNNPEFEIRESARLTLILLSFNTSNKAEIEKDGFRIPEEEQEQLQVQDEEDN
ncbi:MAG: putative serine/threonine-protein kinase Nek6 [Streblomastix strix]|uniref:non-specific serine/threonine protein kinase n=1 Tax=Streblomastix strix TaxID=222440 RepID=A0A5J4V8A1_9EUKA|nr:MAG: putative serine/threonine-protein kinase Nek6 [Streblomastix strix]